MQPLDVAQYWQSIASLNCGYSIITRVFGTVPDQWGRFATTDKWQAFAVNYLEPDRRAKLQNNWRKIIFLEHLIQVGSVG
jgi:hypothetical protein